MKKYFPFILILSGVFFAFASPPTRSEHILVWEDAPIEVRNEEGQVLERAYEFEGAVYDAELPGMPWFYYRFPMSGPADLSVRILQAETEPFQLVDAPEDIEDQWIIRTSVTRDRGNYFGNVQILPIRKTGASGFERIRSFEMDVQQRPATASGSGNPRGEYTYNSVLESGEIYKIAVSESGIHKLDYNFLKNELGISNLDQINPRNIRLYGNGGGELSEIVSSDRIDDLQENAIFVAGEDDGVFNSTDYLLFYGEEPGKWVFDPTTRLFDYQRNHYSTQNYYFLKIDNQPGLRTASRASVNAGFTAEAFNDYARMEKEQVNLLNSFASGYASGRHWVGDYFYIQRAVNYSDFFRFPNLDNTAQLQLKARFLGRANNNSTRFNVQVSGQTFQSGTISGTSLSDVNTTYAHPQTISTFFGANSGESLPVMVEYPNVGGTTSEGWLDYIQINARRKLVFTGGQLRFCDAQSLDHAATRFRLTAAPANLKVWDVSDPLKPVEQTGSLNGGVFEFGAATSGSLRRFQAFDLDAALLQADAVGKIDNQNIHGIQSADMVIIYHESFASEAERLANHRRDVSGLSVALVNVDQLFNEFSSGQRSAVAMRDFARMLYQRSSNFQFLLLFGDGSFDHRDILGLGKNFIPTYQTENSTNPINAFPSDDFFGLLDEGEGGISIVGDLDIAIGRLPVNTIDQASRAVDKIIRYETAPDIFGDWRNRINFVADDGDGGIHQRDADIVAEKVKTQLPSLNIDKLYIDAYQKVPTPGGQRVPGVTDAINQSIFRGVLAITYLGHGGTRGWAQERILQIPDISGWNNSDRMPLFITATCSLAAYDDPSESTAGELIFLNPNGGGIALYTTVRAVYASTNKTLTLAVTDLLFQPHNSTPPFIGEIFRQAKNNAGGGANSRKFTLIGDPAMRLALPGSGIRTTKVNEELVSDGITDTISALQKVTIEGEIVDANGQIRSNFNGTVYPSVFDKEVQFTTLGQDNTPVRDYNIRKTILFRGRASVRNGKFSFTFVVPKDINYEFGEGKISYYAEDGSDKDLAGYFFGPVIGGTSDNLLNDTEGPLVEVFMNSEDFVFGGITSDNPILYVKLQDENGINVTGTSIGHDLTGKLDEDAQKSYLLNDFYEAALDDYTRGEVRYPLFRLAEGRHQVKVRAWDVANNPSEGYTEFVVANSGEIALKHVLNYPNPFVNQTCFQFEHNMEGQEIDVLIHIYAVSGRLVKSLEQRIIPEGSRLSLGDCIPWDGRDDFGDPLAKGVYIYKVSVRASNTGIDQLEGESDFEKLVILR